MSIKYVYINKLINFIAIKNFYKSNYKKILLEKLINQYKNIRLKKNQNLNLNTENFKLF
jgi:hypothetical protein